MDGLEVCNPVILFERRGSFEGLSRVGHREDERGDAMCRWVREGKGTN